MKQIDERLRGYYADLTPQNSGWQTLSSTISTT